MPHQQQNYDVRPCTWHSHNACADL